jgi:hypothetical protein
MFQYEAAERSRDLRTMEDFYYEGMYDIVRTTDTPQGSIPALNPIKAK